MSVRSSQGAYQTNWRRGIIALLVGALAASLIHVTWAFLIGFIASEAIPGERIAILPIAFAANFFVWLIPLTLFATPVWIVLHRRNLRQAWVAALTGAGLSVVGLAAALAVADCCVFNDGDTGVPFAQLGTVFPALLKVIVEGAIVGLIIWRCAYRRVPG